MLLSWHLGLTFGEDDVMEIKRARSVDLFNNDGEEKPVPNSLTQKVPVNLLMCGGMHTVVLTPQGVAYSWGCNDDGALGRQGGNDGLPERVPLPQAVNGLALGGSHSIFYNTELSNAFFCGSYRDAVSGKVGEDVKIPTLFGEGTFSKSKHQRLIKIVSGLDHSVALTSNGKVWAWGDPTSGKIGRKLNTRARHNESRKIS